MKKNSIGFGFENNIKLSERLIATGVGIISVGVVSIIPECVAGYRMVRK